MWIVKYFIYVDLNIDMFVDLLNKLYLRYHAKYNQTTEQFITIINVYKDQEFFVSAHSFSDNSSKNFSF